MPRVTIWIREEDYDKWQAIADKPKWLHEHLNNHNVADNELLIINTDKFIIEPTIEPLDEAP